jgi:hypothetical protein
LYLICKITVLLFPDGLWFQTKKGPTAGAGPDKVNRPPRERGTGSKELPSALLMAIGLQALAALVVVHLETAFLFKVTHLKFL